MADPARAAAHRTLLRTPPGQPPKEHSLPAGLATDLVQGVRRHTVTLDAVIGGFTKSPVGLLEAEMREALRLGVFQLLWHADTPPPLVVASTVALAGRSTKRRGFLNAVLRRIADAGIREDWPADAPIRARNVVRTHPGRVVRFDRDVLPDPSEDLDRYLGTQYALRYDVVAEFRRELPLEIDALLESLHHPLSLAFRTNRLRATPAEAEAALTKAGATVLRRFGDLCEATVEGSIEKLRPLREGIVTVHDVVSAETAPFVGALPGEAILDLCAGVGGKTIHLAEIAERAGGPAKIVACDVQATRLAKLADNVKRLGVQGVTTKLLKLDGSDVPAGPFDRVLVDAPCSNSAVLMKRAEARHRLGPEELGRLATLQSSLLDRASAVVKIGGSLVYATCSLLANENRRAVGAFVTRASGRFVLEEERLRYPHRTGRDGGYMARLRRIR